MPAYLFNLSSECTHLDIRPGKVVFVLHTIRTFYNWFDFYIVLKLCKNENTRKVHATAYESRNEENIALLEEVNRIFIPKRGWINN